MFTTSSYVVIDKVNYDSINGNFNQSGLVPLTLNSVVNNKASNVYLNGNNLFIVTLSATTSPLISSNNTRSFYLSFYSYNINSGIIENYEFNSPSDNVFSYNLNTLVSVTNINLIYNKKQALFNAIITLKDLNNNIFLHSVFYRISNSQVSLVQQKMFGSNNVNITVNYFDNSYVSSMLYNTIITAPTPVQSIGAIIF